MESGLTHLDTLSQHMGRGIEEYQTRVSVRIDGLVTMVTMQIK